MMKQNITVGIVFYFKGEKFDFFLDVNVDQWFRESSADVEYLYDALAHAHGLDRYRHEYDVMVLEPLVFLKGTGWVANHIVDGVLDMACFEKAYRQQKNISVLRPIAKQHLNISNLEEHPDILAALLAAYLTK